MVGAELRKWSRVTFRKGPRGKGHARAPARLAFQLRRPVIIFGCVTTGRRTRPTLFLRKPPPPPACRVASSIPARWLYWLAPPEPRRNRARRRDHAGGRGAHVVSLQAIQVAGGGGGARVGGQGLPGCDRLIPVRRSGLLTSSRRRQGKWCSIFCKAGCRPIWIRVRIGSTRRDAAAGEILAAEKGRHSGTLHSG